MQRKPNYISKVIMDWHGNVLSKSVTPYVGPWALCDDPDDGGDDDPPQDDGEPQKTEAEKELERVLEENRRLKDDAKKSAAAKRKSEADKRTKKAIEDDKLKDELLKREEELEKERDAREALEQAARDRVDRAINKLPKEAQEEIALVRDDLPLSKLEALVERKSTPAAADNQDDKNKGGKPASGGKPPTIGIGGNDRRERKGKHELHPETVDVIKEIGGPDQLRLAENLGATSDGKFGWGRVEDQKETNANFIHLLNRIKATPVGGVSEEVLRGRLEDKK